MNSKELGALPDRELLAESRAYEKRVTDDAASLNFTNAEGLAIKAVNDAFAASLDDWDAVELEHDAKYTAKNSDRRAVLAEIRSQRNRAYADTTIPDEDLAAAGLPPRDKVKTASTAPSSAPIGIVEYGKLRHTINFRDAATPDLKAKPKGTKGCEIWHYIGTTAPVSENDYRYLATDSATPYVAIYEMADAGKKVWYLLRWISGGDEKGEWSETIEATING